MFIRVLEIKRLDPAVIFVPIRQALRARGSMFDLVLPQNGVSAVHVADDDGDVLKPDVVAARVDRNRAPAGSEKLDEFDGFVAEFHAHEAHTRSEHPEEM